MKRIRRHKCTAPGKKLEEERSTARRTAVSRSDMELGWEEIPCACEGERGRGGTHLAWAQGSATPGLQRRVVLLTGSSHTVRRDEEEKECGQRQ